MSNRNKAAAKQPSPLDHPYIQKTKDQANLYKGKLEHWLRSDENFLAPYLTVVEQKTGVSRVVVFLVAVAIITLTLLFSSYAGFLSHLITFIYPALGSLRALETRRPDDDTKWLTYWVVFGFLGLFEHFGEAVLSVLPFYYVLKTGFQLWLCLPGVHNGSLIIYERVLRPVANRFLRINMQPSTFQQVKGKVSAETDRLAGKIHNAADRAANFAHETTTSVRNDIQNKLD